MAKLFEMDKDQVGVLGINTYFDCSFFHLPQNGMIYTGYVSTFLPFSFPEMLSFVPESIQKQPDSVLKCCLLLSAFVVMEKRDYPA